MTPRDEAYEQGSLSPERCERLLNRAPRRAWTPPHQSQIGNPPDVAHCHVRGLRTAKFSGRNLSVRKPRVCGACARPGISPPKPGPLAVCGAERGRHRRTDA
jgi:hypothetical protein